jgi:DNA repair protein RadC
MYQEHGVDSGGSRAYLIAEMPDHERPRERLARAGADALSDTELLAILLRTGRSGRSVLDVARDLLIAFGGSLDRIAHAAVAELSAVPGIGPAKALEVHAAFALAKRLSARHRPDRARLESPAQVADIMREELRGKTQEEFHVLLLDTKHVLIKDVRATVGLLDRSQVHAREVFRGAIQESCSRVILVHNHPSGDPTPSAQDVACTRNLVSAGKIIGIDVLDHVVIGLPTESRPRDFISMREEGLLESS